MPIHVIIIAVVSLVSIAAFMKPEIMSKFQFNAWQVVHRKEYLRLVSHGFLHGDWLHLIINMFVLFSFGGAVLSYFHHHLQGLNDLRFLLLFITALPASSLYALIKHRDNHYYNAIGASGAVSAVVFASILFEPYNPVFLFAIVPVPGIIFGVLYLWYSAYMARRQVDNIGHDAHFWGAVYGFLFPLIYEPRLIVSFFNQLWPF